MQGSLNERLDIWGVFSSTDCEIVNPLVRLEFVC